MPKRIDADARRKEIAESLWNVIRTRGVSAASVRTVAQEAGVSAGSLRHVFPNQETLIEFSAQLMLSRAESRIRAELASSEDRAPGQRALAVLAHTLPLTPDSRAELEVNLALIAEAPRFPAIAAARDEASARLRHLCRLLLESLQSAEATAEHPTTPASPISEARVQRLHALIDGLALHLLMQLPDADPSWALEILEEELNH